MFISLKTASIAFHFIIVFHSLHFKLILIRHLLRTEITRYLFSFLYTTSQYCTYRSHLEIESMTSRSFTQYLTSRLLSWHPTLHLFSPNWFRILNDRFLLLSVCNYSTSDISELQLSWLLARTLGLTFRS